MSKSHILLYLLFSLCLLQAKAQNQEMKALKKWIPESVISDAAVNEFSIDSCFVAIPISDEIFVRMENKSYKKNCTIKRSSLRYLKVLHRNVNGKIQLGEIVCNASIANDLLEIFRKLYESNYKIERIALIDKYNADDETSMTANNTSCFNYRTISGSKVLSKHSQGLAIDVNPLYNPCLHIRTGKVEPKTGKQYAAGREKLTNTKVNIINKNDLCYRLFIQHGFKWGGAWTSVKDYQHFEK